MKTESVMVEIPLMQVTITLNQDYVGDWVWFMEATFVASSAEWVRQLFEKVESTTENSRFDEEYPAEVLGIITDILKRKGIGFYSKIIYE